MHGFVTRSNEVEEHMFSTATPKEPVLLENHDTREIAPYQLITQYRALFLRHEPQRFARMLTSDEAARQQEKYHDASGIITDAMLFEQPIVG